MLEIFERRAERGVGQQELDQESEQNLAVALNSLGVLVDPSKSGKVERVLEEAKQRYSA